MKRNKVKRDIEDRKNILNGLPIKKFDKNEAVVILNKQGRMIKDKKYGQKLSNLWELGIKLK